MAALQHVYLTAHGEFTPAAWLGEFAQVGIRLAIAQEDTQPAKGSTFTMQLNGDVVEDTGTQAGTNGTLTKTWSARLGPSGSSENADGAWQIDLAEDFRAFLVACQSSMQNAFRWTHVKIAPVLANGKYGAPSATYQLTTPIAGTQSTGALMPPEVAVALSLRAPVLGRRGRGRLYLPGLASATMAADGTVAVGTRTGLATALATFVTNLENAPGTETQTPLVVVTSAGSATAVRPSEVRVGTHYDAQRRRQHQVAETYSVTPL